MLRISPTPPPAAAAAAVTPGSGPSNLTDSSRILAWLRSSVVSNAHLKTLVLTDRYGDLTDPKEPLSDEAVGRLLGPRWKLVYSESYNWHYEWRYYIFHTWRTPRLASHPLIPAPTLIPNTRCNHGPRTTPWRVTPYRGMRKMCTTGSTACNILTPASVTCE